MSWCKDGCSDMTKTKKRTDKPIHWKGEEYLTPAEFIVKIHDLLSDPLDNLMQMDGDMYLSDYRLCMDAKWRLHHAMNDLKESGAI